MILGLKYLNGTLSQSSEPNNPILNLLTGTLFLELLLAVIVVSICAIEVYYYQKKSPGPDVVGAP
ncbi:MAG: hypothetical protein OK456_07090 [Thaumarchaeota archaeon]|nr:hypothetical protein [Nitrososphaerota archaeon]